MITQWLLNVKLFYTFDNIGVDNSDLRSSVVGKNVDESIKDDKSTVSGKFIIIITNVTVIYNLINHSCV